MDQLRATLDRGWDLAQRGDAVGALTERLTASDIRLAGISPVEPSLEDVFLDVAEHSARGQA